jgi:hypothetical protein
MSTFDRLTQAALDGDLDEYQRLSRSAGDVSADDERCLLHPDDATCEDAARERGISISELHFRATRASYEREPRAPVQVDPYTPADTTYTDRLWGRPIKQRLFR